MKKFIYAADNTKEDRLKELLDALDDDFAYAIAGIEKLHRDGNDGIAMEQAQALSDALQSVIDAITNQI